MLVLSTLKKEPSYGYKIIQDVSNVIEISESTLYPILKRLEQQAFVRTYTEKHQSRLRKYYMISTLGHQELEKSRAQDFQEISEIYEYILR